MDYNTYYIGSSAVCSVMCNGTVLYAARLCMAMKNLVYIHTSHIL
jgi:hypothetical protein